jgi:gamma-glutamyltranspeptidase/glutathione hydrolase
LKHLNLHEYSLRAQALPSQVNALPGVNYGERKRNGEEFHLSILHGFETGSVTHRPIVQGTKLAVSCGHYLGSMAGMQMLSRGGNAIDAGVATVFAQMILEPQSACFGGECPILIYVPEEGRVFAINGNCRAPEAATIAEYKSRGVEMIPGDGFLAAGVPATPAALILALRLFGTLSLEEVLGPAIEIGEDGFAVYEALRTAISNLAKRFETEWPASRDIYMPGGKVPPVGQVITNRDLAKTYRRLVLAERAHSGNRKEKLQAAADLFYKGDIAREIVAFQKNTTTTHAGGVVSNGLLSLEDLSSYEATIEEPVSVKYRGHTVYKCGPWSQGPVFLQQLRLLEGYDLAAMGVQSADYVHTVVECAKLAFADRDTYYADPQFADVPLAALLSPEYASIRRTLVDSSKAANDWRPGDPRGMKPLLDAALWPPRPWEGGTTGTRAVDKKGNIFSATPSGGWIRSSPVIPDLGFCLGSRMQMFWLDKAHPAALEPMKQPRTTLTPSLSEKDGRWLAFGTPGGDQQDQWTLEFFVNHVDHGLDLQDALDLPAFHILHMPSSFYPRIANPGRVVIESTWPDAIIRELRSRGHDVELARPWSQGNTTAAEFDPERRMVSAAATCRGQKPYAIAW